MPLHSSKVGMSGDGEGVKDVSSKIELTFRQRPLSPIADTVPGRQGPVMTLYELIRRTLDENGGTSSRQSLLEAIQRNPEANARLAMGRGFSALLSNMKHSGFIEIHGDMIRRSRRQVGRRR